MVSTLHHDPSVLGGPTRQRSPSKTIGAGAVAVQRSSSCEEIPQGKGQRRSPSKTVGGAKSHLESYPIPARNAQGAQTNLVRARTRGPHRDSDRTVCELLLEAWVSSGRLQGQRLWVWVWRKPSWRRSPLTHHRAARTCSGLGSRLLEGTTEACALGPGERSSDPTGD